MVDSSRLSPAIHYEEDNVYKTEVRRSGQAFIDEPTVYFVQGQKTRKIKIGFTGGDFANRLSQIQGSSPDLLMCLRTFKGGRKQEKELHKRFKKAWSHGGWFHPTSNLIAYIKRLPPSLADGLTTPLITNAPWNLKTKPRIRKRIL